MKSYTTLRNLYGSFTNNTDTVNLTLGDQMINDSIKTIANIRGGKWWWLEDTVTLKTVASQQAYVLPASCRKIMDLYVKVDDNYYLPIQIEDPNQWKIVLYSRLDEGDTALFYYKEGGSVLIAPTPDTADNDIIIRYRVNLKDLSVADYSTGTIVSVANAGTAVVGSDTTWTAAMAGRYLKITDSDTANKGDGKWYKIASVGSATTLTLEQPYEGTAITAGAAAYTIGQMSPIPEAYDVAPVYRATALYWQTNGDLNRAKGYWMLYDGGYEAGFRDSVGGLIGQMIENEAEKTEGSYISPNYYYTDPNNPPRDLTGF
jgi:hypothetical protein